MQKKLNPTPSYDDYVARWAAMYAAANYDTGLTGYLLGKSHLWCENAFPPDAFHQKVLEVGAGSGQHVTYVRHGFEEYWITDRAMDMLDRIPRASTHKHQGLIKVAVEDASRLSFSDSTFDRIIATHVLEHLYKPHEVLQEWARVLKPGGILSLVLPCDPGLLWRSGRYLASRQKFIREGIDYDYWMAREHVNPINNLVSFVRYYFSDYEETWLPLRVPSIDCNLFYIAHIRI